MNKLTEEQGFSVWGKLIGKFGIETEKKTKQAPIFAQQINSNLETKPHVQEQKYLARKSIKQKMIKWS